MWEKTNNPLTRMRTYLVSRGLWDAAKEKAAKAASRDAILAAYRRAEKLPRPRPSDAFRDVYDTLPPHLEAQLAEFRAHIAKYPEQYPLKDHLPEQ